MNKVRDANRKPRRIVAPVAGVPILVVEDQLAIAQMLAAMIRERWEADVVVARSLQEVKDLVAARPAAFHVASCDLNLPDAPYGEVIDVVNAAGIRSIALTAAYGQELRETILNKGAIDFVHKDNINAFEYVTELVGRLCKNLSIKVLVVDDSMSARALLKHTLHQLCFEVLTAKDGKEALEVLNANPDIRLMLADYNMPEMDGFELTIEARKKFGKDDLAIVGISASDDPGVSARFIKSGANDFIHKPYSYEEFLCRINQNLDMLELIQANRDAAYRDFLTGLHNRRHFFQAGARMHGEAAKKGPPVLAMLDIDRFKVINDRYGHDRGDAALIHLANLLRQHFPEALSCRLGGEEFVVLTAGIAADAMRERLDGFRRAVFATPVDADGESIEMSVSIGVTDRAGADLDEMLRVADANLYRAKEHGRNRIVG